jgi:hypothetical protein
MIRQINDFLQSTLKNFNGKTARSLLLRYRLLTAKMRILPDFLIVGAQKCGTTSLYNYMIQHPVILPAFKKEVRFFDRHFGKGMKWYQAHFSMLLEARLGQRRCLTGEATPYYIFHPEASNRILSLNPEIKVILLLRDPVDRTYSHYNHRVRVGREARSFEDVLRDSSMKTSPDKRRAVTKNWLENGYKAYVHFPPEILLNWSIYADYISDWITNFSKDRMLVLSSEEFFTNPAITVYQVFDFLGLSQWEMKEWPVHMAGHYSRMKENTRRRLSKYFRPHNQRLYRFLDHNFKW